MAASLDHERLAADLRALCRTHEKQPDRLLLARSALMWLCVAEKPLQPHELWIALQVEESKDVEHVERLATQRQYVDGKRAVRSLKSLLGGIVDIAPGVEPSEDGDVRLVVTFRDPEMCTLLTRQPQTPDNALPSEFHFTTPQAHILAASVCMIICSATGIHLAHLHDNTTASSLVLYSWTFWATHLRKSEYSLANTNAAALLEAMVYRVAVDMLVFVLMLKDFVVGPVDFPARSARLPAVASVRRAQINLLKPLVLLPRLVGRGAWAELLHSARRKVEESGIGEGELLASPIDGQDIGELERKPAKPARKGKLRLDTVDRKSRLRNISTQDSQIEVLGLDQPFERTTSLFSEPELDLIATLGDLARSLRAVAVAFVRRPLLNALLDDFAGSWSPLDVLYHGAAWFEAVASYPYWPHMPDDKRNLSFQVRDRKDANWAAARNVMSRVHIIDGSRLSQADADASTDWAPPPGISRSRWYAAVAVEKVNSCFRLRAAPEVFTVNPVRLLSTRETSFSRLPPSMHSSTLQLAHMDPLVPHALRNLYRRRLRPLYERFFIRSGFFKSLDDFSSSAFTAGMSDLWPRAKASLLRGGYRQAFAYFGVAILLHHIRRVLCPWLGLYMYYEPLVDLKMALGSPAVFLDQALSFTWGYVLFMAAQKWATDMFGALTIGTLSLDTDDAGDGSESPTIRGAPLRSSDGKLSPYITIRAPVALAGPVMDIARVGYLVWTFASAEYIFARSINTVAFLIAYIKLGLLGGETERLALGRVLQTHWLRAPLHAWQLLFYISNGLGPIMSGAVLSALEGQAALLAVLVTVAGGVAYVTRFSNKLYIVLELSGLVLVLGLCLVVTAILGMEFVADPLALRESTSVLRKRGAVARRALPSGAAARLGILRGRMVEPVRMNEAVRSQADLRPRSVGR